MLNNDLSHIDRVADSVGSDTCQYSWVVRVAREYTQIFRHKFHSRYLKLSSVVMFHKNDM